MGDKDVAAAQYELDWLNGKPGPQSERTTYPAPKLSATDACAAIDNWCMEQSANEPFYNASTVQQPNKECPHLNPFVKDKKGGKNKKPKPVPTYT